MGDGSAAVESGVVCPKNLFGSALGSGFFIADVSDPTHPVLIYNATVPDGETPFA